MKNTQFGELQKKNMEAAVCLADLSIDKTLKIMELLSELAQALFLASAANAQAEDDAEDLHDLMKLRTEYAQQTTRMMLDSARKIAEVGNDTRLQFSRLLTEQLASGSHELMDAFQLFFKVLPAQDRNVIEAMEQAVARTDRAFEQLKEASAAVFDNANDAARRRRPSDKNRRVVAAGMAVAQRVIEPRAY